MSAVVRRSFVGCPAPLAVEVCELARSFPGLGVVAVRPSARSFSGWVCVCSFASESVARAFGCAAVARFFGAGAFVVVRRFCRRFRVSVPCLSPGSLVLALRPRSVRVGRFRVRVPGRGAAAVALATELACSLALVVGGGC